MADLKISALTASTTPLAGTEVLPIVQSSTTKQVSVANLTAGRAVSAASVTATGTIGAAYLTSSGVVESTGANLGHGTSRVIMSYEGGGNSYIQPYSTSAATQGILVIRCMSSDGSLSTTAAVFDASNVTVNTGNLIIGTSGKGIDFSATPGTGTSELLDDYEEGTWTPQFSDGTNNATMGSSNAGAYTKVGNMVTVTAYAQMSNKGSMSGALRMTGLPYTVGTAYAGAGVGFVGGLSVTAGVSISMYTAASTTYVLLQKFSATTGSTDLLASDMTNDGQFVFSMSYFV
jgi:hypothetical protein